MKLKYALKIVPLFAVTTLGLHGCASNTPHNTKNSPTSQTSAHVQLQPSTQEQHNDADIKIKQAVALIRYKELLADINIFLANMSSEQQQAFTHAYDDPKRTKGFCYVLDHCKLDYVGLRMQDLNGEQKIQLHSFLMKALSSAGYSKAMETMNREWVIEEMENAHRAMPKTYPVVGGADDLAWQPPEHRGALRYTIALFGTPNLSSSWGIRFEGHHLSLNLTFSQTNGIPQVGIAPMFFGSSPMIIPTAPTKKGNAYQTWQRKEGQQLLARESWLAKSLLKSIDKETQAKGEWKHLPAATLDGGTDAPLNINKYKNLATAGIQQAELSDTANVMLKDFIQEFLNNHVQYNQPTIDDELIKSAQIWWFGDLNDNHAEFYFRVQTNQYLIELLQSNTYGIKSSVAANHVHASFRDLKHDWGYNPLEHHIKESHQNSR